MTSREERLADEIALICAMYPERVHWNPSASELCYKYDLGSFELRIPDKYLEDELPTILSARVDRDSVRDSLRRHIDAHCLPGEEVIDSIISAFEEIASNSTTVSTSEAEHQAQTSDAPVPELTVIVWLHHLLNTNKRKQALAPDSSSVSGLTKPGYPGVLIYSGAAGPVSEHVNGLKSLNWQAFQVRAEFDEGWLFKHGRGVIEVEAMKDVVADLGEAQKELFLNAMRMK